MKQCFKWFFIEFSPLKEEDSKYPLLQTIQKWQTYRGVFFSICFPVACNLPLQLTSLHTYSYYNLETLPTNAKINSTGGYRAEETDELEYKFVLVKFDTETVVTGVAMQGYGDPEIKEWVEQYYVSFTRQSSSEKFYVDSNGRPKVMGVMAAQNEQ